MALEYADVLVRGASHAVYQFLLLKIQSQNYQEFYVESVWDF